MQNSFSYERFRTQTHFDTEAQENSEMAYCPEHEWEGIIENLKMLSALTAWETR